MAAHLKSVRAGHKGVLTKRLTDLETALAADPKDMDYLQQTKTTLKEKFDKLSKLSENILGVLGDDTEIAAEVEASEATLEEIRVAIFKIDKIISGVTPAPTTPSASAVVSTSSNTPSAGRIKLPELSLAHFDGNYTKWCTFWDSYESAVHNNPDLSDVVKFNYLQSLLQRSAKEAIAGLALTSANYKEAIDVLTKRFGDKSRITAKHMEALMSIETVTNNHNITGLRRLYDTIETHVRGLQSLGISQDSYGALLSPVLLTRLPQELKLIISRKVPSDNWELSPILEALLTEIQAREKAGVSQSVNQHYTRHKKEQPTGAALTNNSEVVPCCYCQGDHDSNSCTVVVEPGQRQQAAREMFQLFEKKSC